MDPKTLHIAEIALDHYLPAKRQRRLTNTVDGYESSIRLYVVPRWGEAAIADIDPDEAQAWVDELAKAAGPGGAWKAFKCLRQVIRWALVKWRLRVYDPRSSPVCVPWPAPRRGLRDQVGADQLAHEPGAHQGHASARQRRPR